VTTVKGLVLIDQLLFDHRYGSPSRSVDTIARALQLDPTHLIDIANPLIVPFWALVETFYQRRCKYGLHRRIYRTEDAHDHIVLSVDDIPRKPAQTVAFSFFPFCFRSVLRLIDCRRLYQVSGYLICRWGSAGSSGRFYSNQTTTAKPAKPRSRIGRLRKKKTTNLRMDRESRPLVDPEGLVCCRYILTLCGARCLDNTHRPRLGHRQVPWRPMDNLVDPPHGSIVS
jgi:hypothetical protein